MQQFLRSGLLFSSLLGQAACHQPAARPPAGLVGTWRLTGAQCFCSQPPPLPNETLTFTARTFSFYRAGRLTSHGTYTHTKTGLCGTSSPTICLKDSVGLAYKRNASFVVGPKQLVLDYGSCADAPVDTYQRLP